MTTSKFYNETSRIGEKLTHINSRVSRTVEVLERILNAEGEIEISEWAVRAGKIFITFTSPVEIEHMPLREQYIQPTLTVLFPTCRYSGTLVEIESGELL